MSLRAARLAHEKALAEKAAASGVSPSVATAPVAPAEYVYQQQAPSVVEGVLATILHPGVNKETYNVLNGTLIALFIVISLMLFLFDAIESKYRLHLWIFLAFCVSLLLSVNWFFLRFQIYGDDEDEEEDAAAEEEEDEDDADEDESNGGRSAKKEAAPRRSTRSSTRANKKND